MCCETHMLKGDFDISNDINLGNFQPSFLLAGGGESEEPD